MKLMPFKKLVALSNDKLTEALAPVRAIKARAQSDLECAKLDEKIISAESALQELCALPDLSFTDIISKLDEIALAERRLGQYKKVIAELFPEK